MIIMNGLCRNKALEHKNLNMENKVLWLTESKYYDRVLLDVMIDNGYDLTVRENAEFLINGSINLDDYKYIIVTMFLAPGNAIELWRCKDGTKTGIVLLSEIKDKLKDKKVILRVASSIEIDNDEYEWCNENGVTVVNEMFSRYDTILKMVQE